MKKKMIMLMLLIMMTTNKEPSGWSTHHSEDCLRLEVGSARSADDGKCGNDAVHAFTKRRKESDRVEEPRDPQETETSVVFVKAWRWRWRQHGEVVEGSRRAEEMLGEAEGMRDGREIPERTAQERHLHRRCSSGSQIE